MNLDYSKLISYSQFLKTYAPLIDNEIYDLASDKASYFKHHMNDNETYNNSQYKISKLKDALRNEHNIIYKHLIIINTIFNEDLFYTVLERYNTNCEDFISEISKMIILSKLNKGKSLNGKDRIVRDILDTIGKYHGINNYALIVLKLYEIEFKKAKENEKKNDDGAKK